MMKVYHLFQDLNISRIISTLGTLFSLANANLTYVSFRVLPITSSNSPNQTGRMMKPRIILRRTTSLTPPRRTSNPYSQHILPSLVQARPSTLVLPTTLLDNTSDSRLSREILSSRLHVDSSFSRGLRAKAPGLTVCSLSIRTSPC